MKIILKKSLEKLCFLELVNDDMQPQKGRLIYIYWYITIKTLLTFIIKNQSILSLIILLWYRSKFYSHLIPKEYLLYPKWREDNRSLPNFIGQLIESQQWYSTRTHECGSKGILRLWFHENLSISFRPKITSSNAPGPWRILMNAEIW